MPRAAPVIAMVLPLMLSMRPNFTRVNFGWKGRRGQSDTNHDESKGAVRNAFGRLALDIYVMPAPAVNHLRFVAVGQDDALAEPLLAELAVEYATRYGTTEDGSAPGCAVTRPTNSRRRTAAC